MRFFHMVTTFPHKMAQEHWSTLDYRTNISLIGLMQNLGNKDIVAVATYAAQDKDWRNNFV